MSRRDDMVAPREIIFVAARALKARRLTLRKGEPFPIQDRRVIRGYAPAFGCDDSLPFDALDYVRVEYRPL